MRTYRGTLNLPSAFLCLCSKRNVGISVFHGHLAALTVAAFDNKRAGRKVKRVVVRDGHFEVTYADEEDCHPDCAERAECPDAGTPGHDHCGRCKTCERPIHHCGRRHP